MRRCGNILQLDKWRGDYFFHTSYYSFYFRGVKIDVGIFDMQVEFFDSHYLRGWGERKREIRDRYANQLLCKYDSTFRNDLISAAKREITAISQLSSWNFDKTKACCHADLESGKDVPKFEDLNVAQKIEIKVADENLVKHLIAGLV